MDIRRRPGINRDSKTPTPTAYNVAALEQEQQSESDENVTQHQDTSDIYQQTEDEEELAEEQQPQSASVKNTPEPPNRSNRSNLQPSGRKTYKTESYRPESKQPPQKQNDGLSRLCIFSLILLALLSTGVVLLGFVPRLLRYSASSELVCTYDELQRSHPQQHRSVWDSLSAGIENILNKRSRMPAVYLFVHRGGEGIHKLVGEIAVASSKCFGQEMRPVEMKPEDFNSVDTIKDYGHAIEKYKQKAKNGHVILIANLNEIPAEAARALHAICDTHSPIVEDVIIFLTLSTFDAKGIAVQRAVDTLDELWGSMQRHELDPLITRVTDQVIALQS